MRVESNAFPPNAHAIVKNSGESGIHYSMVSMDKAETISEREVKGKDRYRR